MKESDELDPTMTRKYLPTVADLVDRLSIVLLKSIYIPENRQAYRNEMLMIKHDIHVLGLDAETVFDVLVIMLANNTIWTNESEARAGGDGQNHLLRYTHSLNAVRNRAKNNLASRSGDRLDLKVDCLAADLPGDWNVFE